MASGTPVYPGASNAYVPSHESTQGLIVDFSRNPRDFALNKYVKMFPVDKMTGLYARFGRDGGLPEEAGRITDTALNNFVWPDGNDAPDGKSFRELFQYVSFNTIRYAYPWEVGDLAAEQASWSIRDQYARMTASLAMLARTQKAITLATATGNYVTGHTSAVASISGNTSTWDVSTTARLDINRSIDYAVNQIQLDTFSVVKRSDLLLVMSPTCAQKTVRSQEIHDYLKQQSNSIRVITGDQWELKDFEFPKELYGVEVVIEDAVKATNQKGGTHSNSYVLADTTPFIVARPGTLVGTDAKAPNFSSISMMVYDKNEMLVESMHSDKHKRTEGRVVDNFDAQMTASASAFLFTSATG